MHRACHVVGCRPWHWEHDKLRHRVPAEGSRRAEWLQLMGLPVSDPRYGLRVCGRHFTPEDYHQNLALMQQFGFTMRKHHLKAEAVPSLFLPSSKQHATEQKRSIATAPTAKPPAVQQDVAGQERSTATAQALKPPAVQQDVAGQERSTATAQAVKPPAVQQDVAGQERSTATAQALKPPAVQQDVAGQERSTATAQAVKPNAVQQDVAGQERSTDTAHAVKETVKRRVRQVAPKAPVRPIAPKAALCQTTPKAADLMIPKCPSLGNILRPCNVVGCQPFYWRREFRRHRVPIRGSRRAKWLQLMGLPTSDERADIRVCGRHFTPQDYRQDSAMMQEFGVSMRKYPLRANAFPSLFLPAPQLHTAHQDDVEQGTSNETANRAEEIVKKCMRQAGAEAAVAQTTPECPSTTTTHHSCSVVGCEPSEWQREQWQHRVPTQGSRRAEWLRRMGLPVSDRRQDLRICGRHFTPADYHHNFTMMQQFGVGMRKYPLRADALPSLFLPTSKEHHTSKPDGVGQACSCSTAVTAKEAGKKHVRWLRSKTVAAQATCEKRNIATQVHLSLKRKMPVCVKTQTEPLTAEAAVQT